MIDKNKWENWARQWDDKLPNLAKSLRSETLQKGCLEIDQLVWMTRIQERSLIVYVIEQAIADEEFPADYKLALKDEIQNHNLAIEEYKEELKKLNQ
jgi:hypothetical protein